MRRHPLLSLWLRPRATVRALLDERPTYGVLCLSTAPYALLGASTVLTYGIQNDAPKGLDLLLRAPIVAVAFALLGILSIYSWAWTLKITGRWFGGRADSPALRLALVWASVPSLAAAFLNLPILALPTTPEPALAFILLSIIALQAGLGLWSMVLTILMTAEAHVMSVSRSIASFALAVVLSVAPALIAVLLFFAWLANNQA